MLIFMPLHHLILLRSSMIFKMILHGPILNPMSFKSSFDRSLKASPLISSSNKQNDKLRSHFTNLTLKFLTLAKVISYFNMVDYNNIVCA